MNNQPTETTRLIAAAAVAGIAACLLDGFAAGDLIVNSVGGRTTSGLAMLALGSLGAGAGVACLLGIGVILERLPRRRGPRSVLIAAPIAIPLVLLALDLLTGAQVSQVSMIGSLRVAVAMVTYAGVAVVAAAWVRCRERPPGLALAAVTLVIAVGCAVVDAKAMTGLYPSFHYALRLACLALAACVGYGCATSLPRAGRRLGLVGLTALVLLPVLATTEVLPGRDPWARRVLLVWSQTAGPILQRITPVDTANDSGGLLAAGPIQQAPTAVLDAAFPDRGQFNVVWITVDTLRADRLSTYGYSQKTSPAIDALAKESVVFERAYAQHPSSALSFLSMVTSRYPSFYSDSRGAPPKDLGPLLAGLRDGRELVAVTPLQRGYVDRVMPYLLPGLQGLVTLGRAQIPDASRVLARARELMEASGDAPTISFIHLFDPHEPYRPHPETATFRASHRSDSDNDRYDAEVAWADHHLGEFLEWLRARPSWDRTVVIIDGDHGESLGEYGMSDHGTGLWEQQIHVPLIIRVPGATARRVTDPVELIDILPTLEELLGAEADGARHGHSLVSYLLPEEHRGDVDQPAGYAYVQFIRDGESLDSLVEKRWKLVLDHGAGIERLYDLSLDEPEARDFALEDPPKLAEMRAQAAAFRRLARADSVTPTRRRAGAEAGTRISRLQRHSIGVYNGDPRSAASLATLVREDPNDSNGHLALRMLSLLSPEAAFPLLEDLAEHPDAEVRIQVAAWVTLGEQPGHRALLAKLARDGNIKVADTALAGLALLGDTRGAGRLRTIRPANSESGRWHLAARAALGDADALDSLGSLITSVDSGPETLLAAWIAGKDHPDSGIHADLYLRMGTPLGHPMTRFSVTQRLSREPNPAHVAPILRTMLDPGGSVESTALRERVTAALKRMAPEWASKLELTEASLREMREAAHAADLPAVRGALLAAKRAATGGEHVDWGLILEERIVANASDRIRFEWPATGGVFDELLGRPRAQDGMRAAGTINADIRIEPSGEWVHIDLRTDPGHAIAGGFHSWGPSVRVDVLDAQGSVLRHQRVPIPSRGICPDCPLPLYVPIERRTGASSLRVQVVIPGAPPVLERVLPL